LAIRQQVLQWAIGWKFRVVGWVKQRRYLGGLADLVDFNQASFSF
jgi:hypothetical protein